MKFGGKLGTNLLRNRFLGLNWVQGLSATPVLHSCLRRKIYWWVVGKANVLKGFLFRGFSGLWVVSEVIHRLLYIPQGPGKRNYLRVGSLLHFYVADKTASLALLGNCSSRKECF